MAIHLARIARYKTWITVAVVASLIALAAAPVLAQSGGAYSLAWSTVDAGGGAFSTGGPYSLGGAAGQPEGAPQSSGASFGLAGGFWAGVTAAWRDFVPLVLKG
jgi:hypothetical protein